MKNRLPPRAFTLIGLLVVIAVSAFLAAMLLPMMTRAKQLSRMSLCANNLKQCGMGINDYADDNNQLFPPAALVTEGGELNGGPDTWDTLINHYIGGNLPYTSPIEGQNLSGGTIDASLSPKVILCPADAGEPIPPGVGWATAYPGLSGRRSYAMNATVPAGSAMQFTCNPPTYPSLQTLMGNTMPQGIGIYWTTEESYPAAYDQHPPGWPTRIIQDASGTIMLAEHPDVDSMAGNAWQTIVNGPTNGCTGNNDCGASSQLAAGDDWNFGSFVYAAHGQKFNYLFHDNHVSILTWQQTLGTTPSYHIPPMGDGPFLGMWTIKAGD